MADYFYQPLLSFVDPTFLCNSPTSTFTPSVIEDMSTGCYPSLESCSEETKPQILVNEAQFDSISCMDVKAECDSFVIEGESTVKSADCRTKQGNDSTKKKKTRVRNYPNSSQSKCVKEAHVKKQRKCSKNEKNMASEAPPTGYVHVRARRGQATDSHSLAERVRREKISERMKLLQDLVPGCDKVTGKALLLDEIINYVQSLQNQVEFLSMKLASISPIPSNFSAPSPENRGYLPQLEGRDLSYFSTGANVNHQISFNSSVDSAFSGLQNYEFGENELANQRAINNGITQGRASPIWNIVSHSQSLDDVGYNLSYFQQ